MDSESSVPADKKSTYFFSIPDLDSCRELKIQGISSRVILGIVGTACHKAAVKDQTPAFNIPDMARWAHCSEQLVHNCLDRLCKQGLLRKDKKGTYTYGSIVESVEKTVKGSKDKFSRVELTYGFNRIPVELFDFASCECRLQGQKSGPTRHAEGCEFSRLVTCRDGKAGSTEKDTRTAARRAAFEAFLKSDSDKDTAHKILSKPKDKKSTAAALHYFRDGTLITEDSIRRVKQQYDSICDKDVDEATQADKAIYAQLRLLHLDIKQAAEESEEIREIYLRVKAEPPGEEDDGCIEPERAVYALDNGRIIDEECIRHVLSDKGTEAEQDTLARASNQSGRIRALVERIKAATVPFPVPKPIEIPQEDSDAIAARRRGWKLRLNYNADEEVVEA